MRSLLAHVIVNVLGAVLASCSSFSEDCRSTGTCPRSVPVRPYCDGVWRYTAEDGSVCTDPDDCSPDGVCSECATRGADGVWRFPNGEVSAAPEPSEILCPDWLGPGGAGAVGGARSFAGAAGEPGAVGELGAAGAPGAAGESGGAAAHVARGGVPSVGDPQQGGASGRGGSSGVAGVAGAGTLPEPCGGACGGAAPVCSEVSNLCVECSRDEHCAGDRPYCDVEEGVCVACLSNEHCAEDAPYCDTAAGSCVACLSNEHCADPLNSRCEQQSCQGCRGHGDCAHIAGATSCNTDEQVCVECTVDTESGTCGETSCDPATHLCTETVRGTLGICQPCVADSECAVGDPSDPDARCVPMTFAGSEREGGFCLRRGSKGCGRPYLVSVEAESLSGAVAEPYCGIAQDAVSCEAVLDLVTSRTCAGGDDALCGCARDEAGACMAAGEGGLCRDFTLVDDQCTIACGTDNHCPTGMTCTGAPDGYCGQ